MISGTIVTLSFRSQILDRQIAFKVRLFIAIHFSQFGNVQIESYIKWFVLHVGNILIIEVVQRDILAIHKVLEFFGFIEFALLKCTLSIFELLDSSLLKLHIFIEPVGNQHAILRLIPIRYVE
jgi:hypothetical protein